MRICRCYHRGFVLVISDLAVSGQGPHLGLVGATDDKVGIVKERYLEAPALGEGEAGQDGREDLDRGGWCEDRRDRLRLGL